jgi:hypothetical protein
MFDAKCLYCDMLLTRPEREEGLCDSCGKRLPVSQAPQSESPFAGFRSAPARTPSVSGKAIGGLVVFLIALFFLIGMFVVTGDPRILARLVVIPIVAGVGAIVRAVRSAGRAGN